MITLLDASVLIALGDAGHVHEGAAMPFVQRQLFFPFGDN